MHVLVYAKTYMAKFLAPLPHNDPLYFTSTWPGLDWKEEYFMAPTPPLPDYILPGPDCTKVISSTSKVAAHNQFLDYNSHIWSNNMTEPANQV